MIDNENNYYEQHWKWRGGALKNDPVLLDKVNRILRMIPNDVKTILDIGCGDGAITNILAEQYDVTAIDRSAQALTHLVENVQKVQGDATALPFNDGAFDLAFSSQMLEHIQEKFLDQVVREMKRISLKYIFLSVPNDEKLKKRNTFCADCGNLFHLYLHFHSFNEQKLKNMFREWKLLDIKTCGIPDEPIIDCITVLRNRLGKSYFYIDGMDLICPNCGERVTPPNRTVIHKMISLILRAIEKTTVLLLRKKAKLDWLMVLFKKDTV